MRQLLSILALFSGSLFASSTLTIYNIPSPQKYNWDTPKTAYWSLHANLFVNMPQSDTSGNSISGVRTRSLGHNYFKLNCKNPDGTKTEIINGMTMDSYPSDYRGEFHWIGGRGKYGMDFLFHNFQGRLDIRDEWVENDTNNLFRDLNARKNMSSYLMFNPNTGKAEARESLSFISWEISDFQCNELVQYYEDFKSHGGNNRYGFMVHPLNQEGELNIGPELGSGCSEFVTSFLEKAGLMKDEYKSLWKRALYIPNALIGTPNRVVRRRTMQTNNYSWGKEEDAQHTLLAFWDPELMHEWALKMHAHSNGENVEKIRDGKARGILIKN